MARCDPHSFCDSNQPEVAHLDWKAKVDFESRTLEGIATLSFDEPGEGKLDLDSRELEIHSVKDQAGRSLPFTLHPPQAILGSRLEVDLPMGTSALAIAYRTSPTASALQWLAPSQTFGGKEPFLFSQCQAIHARSVVPLQDTPRNRIRFRAELTVPSGLRALMAAAFVRREVRGAEAVETYEMPQPIPPYLLALAVGNLAAKDLGPRSRVWAEPEVLEAAAFEFAGVDAMLSTAEKLFGPYDWDRFDILTMPQSFPYGGMENPRLTFLTPTLLAGDRSLVNVLAHELAHSWTGNLITNANADHFWLNEGFTVFVERRILEALEGPERAVLHAALGRRNLEKEIERLKDRPTLTKLRTDLTGIDPDDAYSQVPYEKGYLFLKALEGAVGREAFTDFLRRYVSGFRFRSITTEEFVEFLRKELPQALAKVDARAWLEEPGIPADAPRPASDRLAALEQLHGRTPAQEQAESFSPTEWALFLESVPRPAPALCEELESRFKLTASRNYEVLVSWLTLAAESGFVPAQPRTEQVLGQVGRMKYLKPLYTALAKNAATRPDARACFSRYADRYHPIARAGIEAILRKHGA